MYAGKKKKEREWERYDSDRNKKAIEEMGILAKYLIKTIK